MELSSKEINQSSGNAASAAIYTKAKCLLTNVHLVNMKRDTLNLNVCVLKMTVGVAKNDR